MIEEAIKSILDEIVTPIIGVDKVYPVFGTGDTPLVTYNVTPISGGTVKESQVEIKAIDEDFDNALILRKEILKRLDMENKDPSICIDGITLRSELAGGGALFSDSIQLWELSAIFIITWREK